MGGLLILLTVLIVSTPGPEDEPVSTGR
jgi:hypothetical protein